VVVKLEDGTDEDVLELIEEYDEEDKHLQRKAMMKRKEEEAKKFGAKDAEELLKDDDDLEGRANGEEKVANGKRCALCANWICYSVCRLQFTDKNRRRRNKSG
jgi:hypothetical protein